MKKYDIALFILDEAFFNINFKRIDSKENAKNRKNSFNRKICHVVQYIRVKRQRKYI